MPWLTGRHSLYRAIETSFIVLLEVFVLLTIKLTAPLSCNLLGLFTGHSPTNNTTGIPKKLILRQEIKASQPVFSSFSVITASVLAFTQLPSWFHHSKLILLITSLNVLPLVFFRGVGCIFFEMATGRPFFPGSTVDDQLHLIFKVSMKWI